MIKQEHAIIIGAVIGVLGVIIAALIANYKVNEIQITIADKDTQNIIAGEVFIDANDIGKPSYPGNPAVLRVKRANKLIRVESKNYKPRVILLKNINTSHIVELEPIISELLKSAEIDDDFIPLSLAGWNVWGGITVIRTDDINVINGDVSGTGGFNNTAMGTDMRGRTIYLSFSNTRESRFDGSRMVKLTYNNDLLLPPNNRTLLHREYIPVEDTPPNQAVEYIIPDDFDGTLGFVFYHARLNNQKIIAYYQ